LSPRGFGPRPVELEKFREEFASFSDIWSHTLGSYFFAQFMTERRHWKCIDFMNKVDDYRLAVPPREKHAELALAALRKIAIEEGESDDEESKARSRPRANSLPVHKVALGVKNGDLESALFDECYEKVFKMLRSFHRPFLQSPEFKLFVECMRCSKRVKEKNLKVLGKLGNGAYGRVVAVEKRDTKTVFAMKELPKKALRRNGTGWMCLNEMKLLSITDSPFVLGLKYSFHSKKAIHLLFDICTGGTLLTHLRKGAFKLNQTQLYAAEIFLGLHHIHSLGYVYRDIKPANVLLTADGHCKITDMGMCLKLPREGTIKHVGGTSGYWAPEVMANIGNYRVSDYWSMGVLLYNMITGKAPVDPLHGLRPKKKDESFKAWSPFGSSKSDRRRAKADPELKYCAADVELSYIVTKEAKDLVKRLWTVNPKRRLGWNKGLREIKDHPFFRTIDWKAVEQLETRPAYIPPKINFKKLKSKKSRASGKENFDFSSVKDDEKEKKFYDSFLFANEEHFFHEVIDALEDDKPVVFNEPEHMGRAKRDNCTVS